MALVTDTHTKTQNAGTNGTASAVPTGLDFIMGSTHLPFAQKSGSPLRPRRNTLPQMKLKHALGTHLYWRRMRSKRPRGSAGTRSRCRAGMMKQVTREGADGSPRGTADACSLCSRLAQRRAVDAFGRAGNPQQFAMRC